MKAKSILGALLALPAILATSLALAASTGGAHVDFRANPNVRDWLRGRYVYLETASGKWRGEEEWNLTLNADGSRTIRIFTLIGATELMRDFVHHVGADFRPLESFQSTWRKGARTGSGYYLFLKDRVEATVSSPNGVFTQRVDVDGPVTMIPHSMAGDGWHFWAYDRQKGGVQSITAINPSAWGDGRESVLFKSHVVSIAYKGTERVKVPAGDFDAERWVIDQQPDGTWVNEIWVHGPHRIMVKFIDHPHDMTFLLDRFEKPEK
ncbi:MAG: hypothetical protein AB7P31_11735 [Steroidobacteraceae bacterium]